MQINLFGLWYFSMISSKEPIVLSHNGKYVFYMLYRYIKCSHHKFTNLLNCNAMPCGAVKFYKAKRVALHKF